MTPVSIAQVLSLPQDHSFVTQALPGDSLVDLPMTPAEARGWEPSPAFDRNWLAQRRGDLNLVHLHFGFDSLGPAQLRDWTAALADLHLPLVVTVHDLRNPHHPRRENHDGQLEILLAAAAAVTTLTPGAAAEIASRFGRRAAVIPHPQVFPSTSRGASNTVGITLKHRAQVVQPDAVVMAALAGVEAAASSGDARLEVVAHPALLPQLQNTCAAAQTGRLTLAELHRADDADFAEGLRQLKVSVLPYRFGTHSGWLEACRDAGTRVVAPDCGYFAEQWDEVATYQNNEVDGLDPHSLRDAVLAAVSASPPVRVARADDSPARYDAVYRTVLQEAA